MSTLTPDRTAVHSSSWRVFATYAFLAVDDPAMLASARRLADRTLAAIDRTCSRFRDDSDLVRANRRPGRWTEVDPLLASAVGVARDAAETTGGLVDPCLGRPLVWLGYDDDLSVVRQRDPASFVPAGDSPVRPQAWRELRVAEAAIWVPEGCALDLGATAKAWASDLVAHAVATALDCHVVVSLGGDVRVDGPADRPRPEGWRIGVSELPGGRYDTEIMLHRGGLATSTTASRRWRTGQDQQHHLLDPRTGRPADEVWRTVSADGRSAVSANVSSTAAIILGEEAPAWLQRHHVNARLVRPDGEVVTVGLWPDDRPPRAAQEVTHG